MPLFELLALFLKNHITFSKLYPSCLSCTIAVSPWQLNKDMERSTTYPVPAGSILANNAIVD